MEGWGMDRKREEEGKRRIREGMGRERRVGGRSPNILA